jgi:hypothetical protein
MSHSSHALLYGAAAVLGFVRRFAGVRLPASESACVATAHRASAIHGQSAGKNQATTHSASHCSVGHSIEKAGGSATGLLDSAPPTPLDTIA